MSVIPVTLIHRQANRHNEHSQSPCGWFLRMRMRASVHRTRRPSELPISCVTLKVITAKVQTRAVRTFAIVNITFRWKWYWTWGWGGKMHDVQIVCRRYSNEFPIFCINCSLIYQRKKKTNKWNPQTIVVLPDYVERANRTTVSVCLSSNVCIAFAWAWSVQTFWGRRCIWEHTRWKKRRRCSSMKWRLHASGTNTHLCGLQVSPARRVIWHVQLWTSQLAHLTHLAHESERNETLCIGRLVGRSVGW